MTIEENEGTDLRFEGFEKSIGLKIPGVELSQTELSSYSLGIIYKLVVLKVCTKGEGIKTCEGTDGILYSRT